MSVIIVTMRPDTNRYFQGDLQSVPPSSGASTALKAVIFILHAASAVFLAVCATKCGSSFVTQSFAESVGVLHTGYPVRSIDSKNSTCFNHRNKSCFFAIPEARDIAQIGLEWNVFALLAAFEWISASFALGHLAGKGIAPVCLVWNLVGVLWLMPYTTHLSLLQTGITVLSLLVASSAQYYPLQDETSMHYTEYCTSASLLFVAVLILYVPEPASWAAIVGFTGILLCNLTGVCAHICRQDSKAAETNYSEGKSYLSRAMNMDWSDFRNHFKLYMLTAWVALFMSIFIIVYLSWDSFSSPDVPWWVRFILINLLVTYNLFGIWATVCYVVADMRGEWWAETGLAYGLSILSAAAKLPIAYTVFYGLIGMPGDNICSVF
jgi:hypothetical protein